MDGSSSKEWTINVEREEAITGEVVFDESIENNEKWVSAGKSETKYDGGVFGDSTLKFKMNISQPTGNSWPSITFRNKYLNTAYNGTSGYCYMICFSYDGGKEIIEFHRFNGGVRTQFYGTLNKEQYGGKDAIENTYLTYGKDHDVEIITDTEDTGVRIILKIDDTEVFNVLDTSENALAEGYLGKMETGRNGFVTIKAAK